MATVNVLFDEDAVTYGGNTVERCFCKVCGAQMFSRTVIGPKQPMGVRAGRLDDPEICPPTMII
jgi:hypothetical protein